MTGNRRVGKGADPAFAPRPDHRLARCGIDGPTVLVPGAARGMLPGAHDRAPATAAKPDRNFVSGDTEGRHVQPARQSDHGRPCRN